MRRKQANIPWQPNRLWPFKPNWVTNGRTILTSSTTSCTHRNISWVSSAHPADRCIFIASSWAILGQLFRSAKRFEPNWLTIQTPPTTVSPYPIDPLLVHDLHDKYMQFAADLSRIYRESIMDIMYVYRFSSDIDLLCRFDSSSPQYKTPMTKQKTESACLIADSAQVEYKQLIQRIRRLFNQDSDQQNMSRTSKSNLEMRMAKASALYIFCYTDTSHARRILSLPWLFADSLIETRKLNIKNQMKLRKENTEDEQTSVFDRQKKKAAFFE